MVARPQTKKYYIRFNKLNAYLHKITENGFVKGTHDLGKALLMEREEAENVQLQIQNSSHPSRHTEGKNYQDCEVVEFNVKNRDYTIIKLILSDDNDPNRAYYIKNYHPESDSLQLENRKPIDILIFDKRETAQNFVDTNREKIISILSKAFTSLNQTKKFQESTITFEVIGLLEEAENWHKNTFLIYHPERKVYLAQKENGQLIEVSDPDSAMFAHSSEIGEFYSENPKYVENDWIHIRNPTKN